MQNNGFGRTLEKVLSSRPGNMVMIEVNDEKGKATGKSSLIHSENCNQIGFSSNMYIVCLNHSLEKIHLLLYTSPKTHTIN